MGVAASIKISPSETDLQQQPTLADRDIGPCFIKYSGIWYKIRLVFIIINECSRIHSPPLERTRILLFNTLRCN